MIRNDAFDLDDSIDRFVALDLSEDDVLWHRDVWDLVGLDEPAPTDPHQQAAKLELAKMDRFEKLRHALLTLHNVDLISVHGDGYRIARPDEQVGLAMQQSREKMQRTLRKAQLRVGHVKRDRLDDEQRREQSEALVRIDQQRSAVRKPRSGWDW